MTITIKHRYTNAIIFTSDTASTVKEAVPEAVRAGADLADADLADADLAGAYLARAYLAGADLARADLARAYLARADLAGADLAGAYLARADLAGANLAGANLAGADLAGANLARAYLARANLAGANLAGANLAGANLAGAYLAGAKNYDASALESEPLDIPIIKSIHNTLLAAVKTVGCSLKMDTWHTCETSHCIGGWICFLAGVKGKALENRLDTPMAARRIYYASDPGCRVPHLYQMDDAKAMKQLEENAAKETEKLKAARKAKTTAKKKLIKKPKPKQKQKPKPKPKTKKR